MKVENVCTHCRKEFISDCYQTFCEDCADKFFAGTLRMCDKCGHTWEVELGECGFASTDEKGYPIELCKKCEAKEIDK